MWIQRICSHSRYSCAGEMMKRGKSQSVSFIQHVLRADSSFTLDTTGVMKTEWCALMCLNETLRASEELNGSNRRSNSMNHKRIWCDENELWDSCHQCGSVRAAQLHPARRVHRHWLLVHYRCGWREELQPGIQQLPLRTLEDLWRRWDDPHTQLQLSFMCDFILQLLDTFIFFQ